MKLENFSREETLAMLEAFLASLKVLRKNEAFQKQFIEAILLEDNGFNDYIGLVKAGAEIRYVVNSNKIKNESEINRLSESELSTLGRRVITALEAYYTSE